MTLHFPSERKIIAYLEQHPCTNEKDNPHLSENKIIELVARVFANKEKNKHLTSLKLKMLKQINKDSIDLERIFSKSDEDKSGGLRVAS